MNNPKWCIGENGLHLLFVGVYVRSWRREIQNLHIGCKFKFLFIPWLPFHQKLFQCHFKFGQLFELLLIPSLIFESDSDSQRISIHVQGVRCKPGHYPGWINKFSVHTLTFKTWCVPAKLKNTNMIEFLDCRETHERLKSKLVFQTLES